MKPKEHILQELEKLKELNPREIPKENLCDEIYRLVMSKKFRKYSVNPEYQDHIRSAIKLNLDKNEPIKFTLAFGGYKLWRLKESPLVDWAELFSLIYYVNWVKPIAEIYKPGIWFDFFSDDVVVPLIDNIPEEDLKTYRRSFLELLDFVKPYLPKNIKITFNRVGDQYRSFEEFKNELDEKLIIIKENFLPLTAEQMATLDLNVKITEEQKRDPKWHEKVQMLHDAYAGISKRRPYYRNPEKIMVVPSAMINTLPVGTTKTSIAKFWVGAGALKREGESFREYVLTPKQLENNQFSEEQIDIPGLGSKNFKTIRIF